MPQLLAIPIIAGAAGAGATGLSGALAGSALGSTAAGGALASGLGAAGAGLTGLSAATGAPMKALLGKAGLGAAGANTAAGGAAADIAAAGTQAQGAAAAGGLGTPSAGVQAGGIGQLGITSEGGAAKLLTPETAGAMATEAGTPSVIVDGLGKRTAVSGAVGPSAELSGITDLAKTQTSGLLEQMGISTAGGAGADVAVKGGMKAGFMDNALENALVLSSLAGGGSAPQPAPAQVAQLRPIGGGQTGSAGSIDDILARVLRGY